MDNQNNQKFEYTVGRFYQSQTITKSRQQEVLDTLQGFLNQFAANGWRLVATAPTREPSEQDYIFERPV